MRRFAACLMVALFCVPAFAQEPQPIDLNEVDPAMLTDMFGPWVISNEDGSKTCKVVLKREETIGGMEIDIDPACEKAFPVMGEIAAWRLLEMWTIDLVDVTRNTRVRFTTPDERYVATEEVDGIFTIEPASN